MIGESCLLNLHKVVTGTCLCFFCVFSGLLPAYHLKYLHIINRVDVASDDGGGGAIVWIDNDVTPLSFKIGLDQSTLSDLSDIQYVVE